MNNYPKGKTLKHLTRLIWLLSIATVATDAQAESSSRTAYADVVDVYPLYETVEIREPRESCWKETVREQVPVYRETRGHQYTDHRRSSATSTIIGGIVGGAIGHALGAGDENKKVGAAVGTVLGMSIGNDVGRAEARANYHSQPQNEYSHSRIEYRDVERCQVDYAVRTERELRGYNVTYRFHGNTYSTTMDHHPGSQIKVLVNVQPIENY